MSEATQAGARRETTNPLFNDRPLKLGTFCANLSHGAAVTTIDGVLKADWPSTMTVARAADEMEFEAQFSVARWRGFGGPSNFNEASLEPFAWTAGVTSATDYSCVLATCHVPTLHPIMAAKQGMTIDHIGGGRFALNIVVGWHRQELEMFGAPLREHAERYRVAEEWVQIIKRLWTEDDEFDFEGKYFQVKKARIEPKPIQRPHPVIVNAAGSETGRRFAAKYCDMAFVLSDSHEFEAMKARIDHYRDFAREEYGRELKVWVNGYVVQGDTEKDARDFLDYYVNQKGDWEASNTMIERMGIDSKVLPPEGYREMQRHFIAGYGGFPLVGTAEQIVDKLAMLVKAGADGVLLTWARYIEGIQQFQRETMPLLQQAGLR